MRRCFIIHRWSGGPKDDWRPWLKGELEKEGVEVFVPAMPDTDEPTIEKWVGKLTEVVGTADTDTFFVGHSIGNQAILRYLETLKTPVGGAVFVAGWFDLENLEDEETEVIARPWIETPIDLECVKSTLPNATLIISDNDPYGAYETNVQRFTELGAKIITLKNAGHITEESGYGELPEACDALRSMMH